MPHLGANLSFRIVSRQGHVRGHGRGDLSVGVEVRQSHQGGAGRLAGSLEGAGNGWPIRGPAVVLGVGAINDGRGPLRDAGHRLEITRVAGFSGDPWCIRPAAAGQHRDLVSPVNEGSRGGSAGRAGPNNEKT